MESHRKDSTHDVRGRLNVHDACFDCPRPKSIDLTPLANGNGEVLVPDNFPIRLSGLIEEDPPHREAFRAENSTEKCPHRIRNCHLANNRHGQQVSLRVFVVAEVSTKSAHCFVIKAGRNGRESLLLDLPHKVGS